MTFPRNPKDNSLDFTAFDKLDLATRTAILKQLRTDNPDEFAEAVRAIQARQAMRTAILSELERRDAQLDAELNTYTAAYRREMANAAPARLTAGSGKKTIKTCSIS